MTAVTGKKHRGRKASKLATFLGIRIAKSRVGYAQAHMRSGRNGRNPCGRMHGRALATLADITATAAASTLCASDSVSAVTVGLTIQYLAAASDDVVAKARVQGRGKSLVHVGVEISTARGREIALASAIMKMPNPP